MQRARHVRSMGSTWRACKRIAGTHAKTHVAGNIDKAALVLSILGYSYNQPLAQRVHLQVQMCINVSGDEDGTVMAR